MSDQQKQQSAMEAMGQLYAVSLLPFVVVTIGAFIVGWKFTTAATAGLWAGPGFVSVFVVSYYAWKGVQLLWSDIFSTLPRTVQRVLEWTVVMLIVALLAFALAVTVTGL